MNDLSSDLYSVNKNIRFKIVMLRSDLCDYSDAYIVVKGTIDLLADDANKNDKAQENVAFKNNALFRSYFSKINSILIDIAEYLNIVKTPQRPQRPPQAPLNLSGSQPPLSP